MTIRLRTAFFAILGILILWFLYVERQILTPFVLAGVFAYIINPLINFLSLKLRLPRTLSVIIIYFLIIGGLIWGSLLLSSRILEESSEIKDFANKLLSTANSSTTILPNWLRPAAEDVLNQSKLFTPSLITVFPRAITGVVNFVIFLFAGFFFLKEGRKIVDKFINFVPNDYKIEVEILLRRINTIFGGYLRGQLLLVFFVSAMLFITFSIIGLKFALVLAIFSGFAEIVPFIGPIVAGAIGAIVAFATQTSNFNLNQFQLVALVIAVYFVLRQLEDYFVIPLVMGKITKLHPLLILFAVLAGGHLAGVIGLILAVPVAAIVKILLEFSVNKVNDSSLKKQK